MTMHQVGAFILMPCKPGVCQLCAVDHQPEEAHNAQSMFYQYRFYGKYGRWPTWADAIAHCDPKVQAVWKEGLQKRKAYTEPVGGEPISERGER